VTGDPRELIDAYLDGELTPEGEAELAAWLAADREHLRRFVFETHAHRQLRDLLVSQGIREGLGASETGAGAGRPASSARLRQIRQARPRPLPAALLGIAAAAAILVGIAIHLSRTAAPPADSGPIARQVAASVPKPPAAETNAGAPVKGAAVAAPDRPAIPPSDDAPAVTDGPGRDFRSSGTPAIVRAPEPPATRPSDSAAAAPPAASTPGELPPTPAAVKPPTLPAVARLDRAQGDVLVLDGAAKSPAKAGQVLLAGQGLDVAGPPSAAVVVYPDATRLELAADTTIDRLSDAPGAGGKRVGLSRGVLAAEVMKQPAGQPMVFVTPHAEATVLGTRLTLAVKDESTRLSVDAGRVRLARSADGAAVTVETGRYAIVAAGTELAAKALETPPAGASPFQAWKNGPPKDPAFFPIGVWTQSPAFAAKYRDAGINLYIQLWEGPTERQLTTLRQAGMQVVCGQNEVALRHRDDPTIAAWILDDGPDNAQPLPDGKGYGPPMTPEAVMRKYEACVRADPTRPVVVNFGQGVAWDGWYGRGVRANHPEDYVTYAKACDIASFAIYPVTHPRPEIAGRLGYVAQGVERLLKWTGGRKPVWSFVEGSRIESDRKPTPAQVRAEAWLGIIHGSTGLVYFVHEWKPRVTDHALLEDPELLAAVTALNRQIRSLAPVLNSPTVKGEVSVGSGSGGVPVGALVKRCDGALYVFAAALREGSAVATFTVPAGSLAEVLGEGREIEIRQGRFSDAFKPWDVHLYRIRP
jgi:ferric-dicitrate binding protein FerR (iron transport regulator)